MPLELTQPWFLLGAAGAAGASAWYFYRGLTDFARWQRVASLVARARRRRAARRCPVRPDVAEAVEGPVRRLRHRRQPERRRRGEAGGREVPRPGRRRGRARTRSRSCGSGPSRGRSSPTAPRPSTVNQQGTNIAAALEVATAAIPPSLRPADRRPAQRRQPDRRRRRPGRPPRRRAGVAPCRCPARTEPEVQVSGRQRAGPGPRGRAVLRRGRHRLQPRRRGRGRGLPRGRTRSSARR